MRNHYPFVATEIPHMLRYFPFVLLLFYCHAATAQRIISPEAAVELALANQRNLKAAGLTVQQQEQLLRAAADFQSPQVFGEATPYEPLIVGVQQTFSLPGVYRKRKALQHERLRLAQLQLQGAQYDLKRDVRNSYLQVQYLSARKKLLAYQDSVYQEIKIASKRFFDAGQINKLEELQAATQADQVRNELVRIHADLEGELQVFRFYTNLHDSVIADPLQPYLFVSRGDTSVSNIQQQLLQQQVSVNRQQLQVERSELLPQLQAGVSFPTARDFERPIGYQLGVTLPIWRRQNRSRIAAAESGIEIARAQQELEQQRLNAQFRQAIAGYQRELQSLNYFNTTALPQARAIMETSQRLFQGGELNYIESLRNLQTAFDILLNHLETQRAYNEAVNQLNYLNGTL